MPDAYKELGERFPKEGITAMDFECNKCHALNNIPMDLLEDILTEAQATAHFITMQKRFEVPMFAKEEMEAVASAASQYLITKRKVYNKWKT